MDSTFSRLLFFALLISSAAAACDRCIHMSKAKFLGDAIPNGACGYKDQAPKISWDGYVAAGNPALIKQGVGCGACYKLRCRLDICNTKSVKVVLTDSHGEDSTAFLLSPKALSALAMPGQQEALKRRGIIDVEYKRVYCGYGGTTMKVQVEDGNPNYLAIKFLYPGEQTDILGVAVASAGSTKWVSLSQRYNSAVWEYNGNVPGAPLDIQLKVATGLGSRLVIVSKALPFGWKKGLIYDTNGTIKDVVQEQCYPCDPTFWPSTP